MRRENRKLARSKIHKKRPLKEGDKLGLGAEANVKVGAVPASRKLALLEESFRS